MKVFTIMWSNYIPPLKEACTDNGVELTAYSTKQATQHPEVLDALRRDLGSADCILLYRTSDPLWDELETDIRAAGQRRPIVVVGSDPTLWGLSTVSMEIAATAYNYILYNGADNLDNLVKYLRGTVLGEDVVCAPPRPVPWEGLYHPLLDGVFDSTDDYLRAYRSAVGEPRIGWVGVLYSRSNWVNRNLEVEKGLIAELENLGLGVIPAFFYSIKDAGMGNLSGAEVVERFFTVNGKPFVQGVVKLTSFFLGSHVGGISESDAPQGVELFKRLNIPLFSPVISYYQNEEQWRANPEGLGAQVGWSMAMPEFEGVIEPLVIGASSGTDNPEEERYLPIPDRMQKFAGRVARWVELGRKPNAEKKVAFILHNNPCVSVEASVGGAAHLDSLESVALVLQRMKTAGYNVTPPNSGKELIDTIMERKAISEFRWTTVEEIVAKNGALDLLEPERYRPWFEELPEATRQRMCEAWGNPPGEEKDGIPPAMVHDGRILITGVQYGNVVVCAQPKRGCAGARCDGQVCKILHDPDVPPPHQYVATYKWLAREFGVDAIVHVGTHGNLEFLPGKATGLSSGCFPDIGIDTMPHLYIYNADNPPEGTIAKRRSYATLVNHLQTVMVPGELYGDLEAIERLLEDYRRFKTVEPGKAHTISHMIAEKVKGLQLIKGEVNHDNVESKVDEIHDALAMLKGTRIPKGMHVFGKLPEGESLSEFVYAIVRYENTPESLRGLTAQALGRREGEEDDVWRERVDAAARLICKRYLEDGVTLAQGLALLAAQQQEIPPPLARRGEGEGEGAHGHHHSHIHHHPYHDPPPSRGGEEIMGVVPDSEVIANVQRFIDSVRAHVLASDETGALFNGFNAGYIPPGPSGLMTRGRPDILPTGRNFYSLDPHKLPSPVAWETGKQLAEKTLDKYLEDEGRYPENIAFHWQCTDIMWTDGEGMAQMLHLLGVCPVWQPNGRVRSFTVTPLEELGRPRIDITVRVSGITRDNFPSTIDLLDEAVQAVAMLDEPMEMNYVRKHTLEKLGETSADNEEALREATYRIFASMPGTYQAGTQLAVYASAWETEQDLSDIFLYWNGYAYGKGTFGAKAHNSLKESLRTVSLTFNKTASDEYDLTGCCCYFGTHGGMINAARVISGNEIKNYYGDTREQGEVQVRTLEEEMRRVARGKILNPVWIEGMKEHGYKGAGEISKRVGRLYGWQATAKAVDDAVFDDVARTFMMNEENREFFEKENPWALEEIGRRLLEAAQRGLWQPADDVKEQLQDIYLEIEGWMEERMGDTKGEFQGGSINIITAAEVVGWKSRMAEVLG
jgi:cobaltochelatase CobN